MYSQGIHPVRIGFAELLVRFTELSFTKLPILLIGSILVEAASNTLGLGYYLLDVLRSLENNRVDLNILTGISFTLILLVLLSQKIAEYVRVTFDPQLQL
jgi:ABC-type dipeptide/oligopeptide/nickel transport system permease component